VRARQAQARRPRGAEAGARSLLRSGPRLGECTGIMASTHAATGRSLRYKFVELSLVTDETLERAVNEWVAQGWSFDRIHFVTSEASRRPVMAFVGFVREVDVTDAPVTGEIDDDTDAVNDYEEFPP
jgi:hypothetical protein